MKIGERVCKISKWFPVESFEIFEHFAGSGVIIGFSSNNYIVEWGSREKFLTVETDLSISKQSEVE